MSVLPVVGLAVPARCPPLQVEALATEAAGQLAPMFKALSDPIRLRLLSLIASTTEVCVCDLTDAFEVTGATISHHLRVLRETGLVDADRRGTWVFYRVKQEALDLLGGLLTGSAQPTQNPSRSAGPVPQKPKTQTTASGKHHTQLISANPDVVRLLGDPLRAQIVRILADGPATTSHVVADTGAKQPNVSGHLKQLREAGVVTTEPRGRFTYYRLVPESLQGAALHLADLAADARTHTDTFRDC